MTGPSFERLGPDEMAPRFRDAFPRERFIVVSNREPYEHRWGEDVGEVEILRPAGGLTSALDPLLQATGGVWIAWGSGDADAQAVDTQNRVQVPPEDPAYTLRRLWLDQRDIHGYYLGFANQLLWPLCHLRPTLTRVRARHWDRYRRVNRRFAEAVLDEARGLDAAVWFQDYHLALAPHVVRSRRPDLSLAHFWHIPWPPLEIFRITPQAADLMRGLLANDLMGFHLPAFGAHFLHCAAGILGAEVDWDDFSVTHEGHTCYVRDFPISIDVEAYHDAAKGETVPAQVERIRDRYVLHEDGQLGIGIDRMDYSKGLPEKLKALDLLWQRYPEFRERFTFVQVGVPSRTDIEAYDELTHKVERLAREINDRYATGDWRPVHLIKRSLPPRRLAVLYRAAELCIVSSLQDGMNLVAKEFAASQVNGEGVLLLSRFAGATAEMDGAVDINPYDPEDLARRIRDALTMSPSERAERAQRMHASLRTIYDWMNDIFIAWGAVRRGERPPLHTPAALPTTVDRAVNERDEPDDPYPHAAD